MKTSLLFLNHLTQEDLWNILGMFRKCSPRLRTEDEG